MEGKVIVMNDKPSFLSPAQEREKRERLNRLFVQAVGSEDVSRRTENTKHFNLGANRYQAVVFSEPVHFRASEKEEWKEIDNTLEEAVNAQGRNVLRNRANRVRMEFPKQMDGGSMASVSANGKTFAWRFEQEMQPVEATVRTGAQLKQERLIGIAREMPKYAGCTLDSLKSVDLSAEIETEQERRSDVVSLEAENTYKDVLPGVSIRYTLDSDRVKEDIILFNDKALRYTAIRLPKQYDYDVTVNGEVLVHDKDTGEIVFTMETPFVYDAQDNETVAGVVLTDCDEYVRMEYVIDEAYRAKAIYPITIDPVVTSSNAIQNIEDTTIGRNSSNHYPTQAYMMVGKYNSTLDTVSLLKFVQLAKLTASDTVISAILNIAPKSSSSSKYIAAYEILKPWNVSSVAWTNFNPDNTENVAAEAIECVAGSSTNWLSFDLTNLYRKWCTKTNGVSNNNGVAFRTPANITGANYSELYSANATSSSNRPKMYVSYISHAGIEGWWQYESMSVGRAGTAYSDLFNGNMVMGHSDTVMTGNRCPVSVNHYYNSCLSHENKYGCGYGWKTDAHQKVEARIHGDRNYFVWVDGDGTEHFFEQAGSQPYSDSEGMELKLTYDDSNHEERFIFIEDKGNNKMCFKVLQDQLAWLVWTKDACGNTTEYSYVTDHELEGRLSKIKDPADRETVFSYSGNLLSSIRIPDTNANTYRYVYFTYDSASRLTGIRYSDLGGTAPHTTYSYDDSTNMLIRARNYDGLQVNIGYEPISMFDESTIVDGITDQMRRVLSLETVATNSSGSVTKYGAKQIFEYKHMCTEVTAVENTSSNAGKKLYYQFNDSGNVVCVRDELGYAKFTKYESNIENKPSEESRLRKVVINLLRHSDLSANWTSSGIAAVDGTNRCLNTSSVKLTANYSESRYRQEVTLKANTTYTFSAYVKTSAVIGTGAFLRLSKKTNTASSVISETMTGTTAAAIGNELPTDGWERVCIMIAHNVSMDEVYYADMVLAATSGYAWFACPQVETGVVANSFNVVSNGDFRYTTTSGSQTLPADWTKATNTLSTANTGVKASNTDSSFPEALSGNYLAIEGAPDKAYVGFTQTYNLKGNKGDVYTVGGWANSHSLPKASGKYRFCLLLRLQKLDGSWSGYAVYDFNEEWVGWQFASFAAVAAENYQKIELTISYLYNCNISQFSNIFLHREAFGESYAYDDDKNLIAVGNLAGQKSKAVYDSAKNVTKYTQPGRDSSADENQYLAYYGNSDAERKKHLPWRTRTPMNMLDYFSYDDKGNITATSRVDYQAYTHNEPMTVNVGENDYLHIRTENTYTSDGNYTASTKDARGNTVTQTVNTSDGTLTSVKDPTNQTVNYTYDAAKRVTGVQTTGDGKTYRNAYTYENDRIKTVSHNTTSDTATDVTYTFAYDALGRKTTVKVGTQTLSTNVYANDRNGLLNEVQYGNGGKVKYSYDEFDRLTGMRYDSETVDRYTYEYGANGQAAEVTDNNLNRVARTEYDLADRPCQTELRDGSGNVLYRTGLKYDKLNNLQQFSERVGATTHTSGYTYDRDNRVTQIAYDGTAHKVGYAYDALGRVATRTAESGVAAGKLTSSYSYVSGGYGANSTTPLVSKITQSTPAGAAMNFEYEYDIRGNITKEKRGSLTISYTYDAPGQLVRVNDPHDTTSGSNGTTWVYNYDRGGNILSKVRYAYTTGTLGTALQTIPYTYGDSNWKDKLTAYNGTAISYDAIGNPLSDGTWTYTWGAGRQLRQMSKSGMTVQFKYGHNGLRTQKMVTENGVTTTTNYVLHGKLITHMTRGTDSLHFFYDAQSRPAKVSFNGVMYTYVHNLQGDIVGILDSNGTKVVEYWYDAWGKPIGTVSTLTTDLASLNPFRYRGYVYDTETGLYYLRSRYYNTSWGRFISGDCIVFPALLQVNNYAYVCNNPVVKRDSCGCAAQYSIYLNVYSSGSGKYKNNGHYDITITSSDGVIYMYNNKQYQVPALTFSYGYDSSDKSSGRLEIYTAESSYDKKDLAYDRFLIYSDISQGELDAFIGWMAENVFDGGPNKETYGYSFSVKGLFREYSYEGSKRYYCGPASLYFISGIRKVTSSSRLWKPLLTLTVLMLINPLKVVKETVSIIESVLGITHQTVRS